MDRYELEWSAGVLIGSRDDVRQVFAQVVEEDTPVLRQDGAEVARGYEGVRAWLFGG